jgi:sulfatase maturation enzyme AslB (radical SAM superfamily)
MTDSVNEKKWREYLIKRIDPGVDFDQLLQFPRYFEIETVNACNARCPMCTITDWNRKSPMMKDDLFEKIAAEISDNYEMVKRVSLYRDGEPLLDKKLPQRISRLKEGNVKEVAISTNGSLMNEKWAKDILDAEIDLVLFSIDSLQKDVFEQSRAGLKFEEVLQNTLNFISQRDKMNSSTKVWIRMIRQESNADEWPTYEKYWRDIIRPTDRVNFANLHNWGNQLKSFTPVSKSYEPNLPCVVLWSQFIVFANGAVPLCSIDYNNKFPNGNLIDSSIAELWKSQIMTTRRQLHLNDKKSKIEICDNCNVWDEPSDFENISQEFAEATNITAA